MGQQVIPSANNSLASSPFLSNWRRFFGRKERLRVSLDSQGTVRAQVLAQGTIGKIGAFLNGRNKDYGTYVADEKTFSHVTKNRFVRERDKLQQLDQNKTSVLEMLKALETDLSTPSTEENRVTPEQIAQRKAAVESERQKLLSLLEGIQTQERTAQDYGCLLSSIQRVKDAAQTALNELQQLGQSTENSSVTQQRFESDLQRLSRQSDQWGVSIAETRQSLMEAASLQSKADGVTEKLKFFSEEIQKSWKENLKAWKSDANTQVSTLEQVRAHGRALETLIHHITERCKAEVETHLQSSETIFKAEMARVSSARVNSGQQNQMQAIRTKLAETHLRHLEQIVREKPSSESRLDAMIEWGKKAQGAWNIGSTLSSLLNREISYSWGDRVWNYFSRLTSKSGPSEIFDEIIVEYIHIILAEIGSAGLTILEELTLDKHTTFDNCFLRMSEGRAMVSQNELEDTLKQFLSEVALKDVALAHGERSQRISCLYECLKLFLSCQHQQRASNLERLNQRRQELIAISNHPSLLDFSQQELASLNEKTAWNPDLDLGVLTHFWKQERADFRHCTQQFDTLKELAELQKKYTGLASSYIPKVNAMTGPEKLAGQKALEQLRGLIDFRPLLHRKKLNDSFVTLYKKRLEHQDIELLAILDLEERKEQIRKSVKDEVDRFLAELSTYKSQVEALERKFNIPLTAVHTTLEETRKKTTEWKNKGLIRIGSFLFGEYEQVTLLDIDLAKTADYQLALGGVLANERSILQDDSDIPQAHNAHAAYEAEVTKVKDRIREFRGQNLLQFKHAEDFTKKLNETESALMHEVSQRPSLSTIERVCKRYQFKLSQYLQEYRAIENMSLVDQMRRFEGNAEKEQQIRQAFLTQVSERIKAHVNSWKSRIETLREFPTLHNEATIKIKEIIQDLEVRLNVFPTVRGFFGSLNPFSQEEMVGLSSLSRFDMSEYERNVNTIIRKGISHIELYQGLATKVRQATQLFDDKAKRVKEKADELEQSDQILFADRLNQLIKDLKNERRDFLASPGNESYFFFFKRNTLSAYAYLKEYNRQVGRWIGRMEQELRSIDTTLGAGPLSIPQQLERSPGVDTEKRLRNRYTTLIEEICDECKEALNSYQRALRTTLRFYIPEHSRLFRDMEEAIEEKIREINQYKTEFTVGGFAGCFTRKKSIESLKPRELKAHLAAVEEAGRSLLLQLKTEFPLDLVIEGDEALTRAISDATAKSTDLRNNGQYYHAYKLNADVQVVVTEKDKRWKGKVLNITDIRALVHTLRSGVTEVRAIISRIPSPVPTLRARDQLIRIFREKEPTADNIKALRDSDTSTLRQVVIDDVRQKVEDYRKELLEIANDIEEIDRRFKMPRTWKMSVFNSIRTCEQELSNYREQFSVSTGWFISTSKRLDDMTPEEVVNANPEAVIERRNRRGFNAVTSQYNIHELLDNYRPYKLALKNANELHTKFLSEGQIVYAFDLKKAIDKVEKDLSDKNPSHRLDMQGLTRVVKDLRDATIELNGYVEAFKTKPKMDFADQISLLTSASYSSLNAAEVRSHLVEYFRTQIAEPRELLGKIDQGLANLRSWLSFPEAAVKKILDKLDPWRDKLGQLYADFNTASINFQSFAQLIRRYDRMKTAITEIKKIEHEHRVVDVGEAAKQYMDALEKAQNFISDMEEARQRQIAKSLTDDVNAIKMDVATICQNSTAPSFIFSSLVTTLGAQRSKLLDTLRTNKAKTRQTIAQLLGDTSQLTAAEKAEVRATFIAKLTKKINDYKGKFGEYQNKIDATRSMFETFFAEKSIPISWCDRVRDVVQTTQAGIEAYLTGFPQRGGTTKAFADLSPIELMDLEKEINDVTHTDKGKLKELEREIHLNGVHDSLRNFKNAATKTDNLLKDPASDMEDRVNDKADLQSIFTIEKNLVERAFNNMRSEWDGGACFETVQHAALLLEVANARFEAKKGITQNGWTGEFGRWAGLKRVIETIENYKIHSGYERYREGILRGPFGFKHIKTRVSEGRLDDPHEGDVLTQNVDQDGILQNMEHLDKWINNLLRNVHAQASAEFLRTQQTKLRLHLEKLDRLFSTQSSETTARRAQNVREGNKVEIARTALQDAERRLREHMAARSASGITETNEDVDQIRERRTRETHVTAARRELEEAQRDYESYTKSSASGEVKSAESKSSERAAVRHEGPPLVLDTYDQIIQYRDQMQLLCQEIVTDIRRRQDMPKMVGADAVREHLTPPFLRWV